MSTTYVDGTTPLDAAHMNALQQKVEKGAPSGYVGLDSSSNVTLPANLVVNGAAMIGATLYLGNAYDTSLYRRGAGVVQTDGSFYANTATGYLGLIQPGDAGLRWSARGADGMLQWGPGSGGADTNLYRASANVLKTDGRFVASEPNVTFHASPATAAGFAFYVQVSAEAQPRFVVQTTGQMNWGPGGAAGTDATLYRAAAGTLKTDGGFQTGGAIQAGTTVYANNGGSASQVIVGYSGATGVGAALSFGPGNGDTNLYRFAAGGLRTDGQFGVGGPVYVDMSGAGNGLYFGSAQDTSLVRYSAATLSTPGKLFLGLGSAPGANGLFVFDNNAAGQPRVTVMNNGVINFGSGGAVTDTNLYRYATGELKTDNWLESAQRIIANHATVNAVYIGLGAGAGVGPGIIFGSAQDTNLYRSTAATLKTDAAMEVGGSFQVMPSHPSISLASMFILNFKDLPGGRIVQVGPPDSGGAGNRVLTVTN